MHKVSVLTDNLEQSIFWEKDVQKDKMISLDLMSSMWRGSEEEYLIPHQVLGLLDHHCFYINTVINYTLGLYDITPPPPPFLNSSTET